MPPNMFEVYIKQIKPDKSFDVNDFLENSFTDFLNSVINFINSSRKDKSSFFKKNTADIKATLKALSFLISNLRSSHLKPETTQSLVSLFIIFLNPFVPEVYRIQTQALVLNVLDVVPEDTCNFLFPALNFFVPWNRIARDNEKSGFLNIWLDKNSFQNSQNYKVGTTEEGLMQLKEFLSKISENYTKNPKFYSKILFNLVLIVIFKDLAQSSGLETYNYGFTTPIPETLNAIFMGFMKEFINNIKSNSLKYLFETKEKTTFVFQILMQPTLQTSISTINDKIVSLNFLSTLLSNENDIKMIIDFDDNLFLQIENIISIILTQIQGNKANDAILNAVENTLVLFFKNLILHFQKDKTISTIYTIFNHHHYDIFLSAFELICYINFLLEQNVNDFDLWKIVCNLSSTSDVLSAVSCKYAQYLALVSFPLIFHCNLNEVSSVCESYLKKKRNNLNITTKRFWIVENIDKIINNPSNTVKTKLVAFWAEHSEFDNLMKELKIPELFNKENIMAKIDIFLKSFDIYPELDSQRARRSAFAPIITFYHTLLTISYLPIQIKSLDFKDFLKSLTERLPLSFVNNNDSMITYYSFLIYSEFFNQIDRKCFFDEKLLSLWYTSLILLLLRKKSDLVEIGFEQAVKSITNGFIGSSMLIPLLLTLCEKERVRYSDSVQIFLSSIPVYFSNENIQIPKVIIDSIKSSLDLMCYMGDSLEILNQTGRLKERTLSLLNKYHKASLESDSDIPLKSLLNIYFILISHEISYSNDPSIIENLLTKIFDAFSIKCFESLSTIIFLLTYHEILINKFSAQFMKFITLIIEDTIKIDFTKNEKFNFFAIKTVALLLIHSYKLTSKTNLYAKFLYFLNNFSINVPTSIPLYSDINQLVDCMISLLTIHFGRYPFPNSPYFPTNISPNDLNKDYLFTTANDAIMQPIEYDGGVKIFVQNSSGHFEWNFEPIGMKIMKESENKKIKFPLLEIPEKETFKFQNDFSKKFDDILSDYSIKFKDNFETNNIQNNFTEIPNISPNEEEFEPPRIIPKTSYTNICASVLTGYGGYQENLIKSLPPYQDHTDMLKSISLTNHRVNLRIGIIYIPFSQGDQVDILSTSYKETSSLFKEFITGIGWNIDFKTHVGYDGGLNKSNDVITTVYYADFMNEVVFHVAPYLPYEPNDVQQQQRKKHVSNCVNIVWCNCQNEYDTYLMSPRFENINIVIYPLEIGFFKVDVIYNGTEWIGPLAKTMIVSKINLPLLVRLTAIESQILISKKSRSEQLQTYSYPQDGISAYVKSITLMGENEGMFQKINGF